VASFEGGDLNYTYNRYIKRLQEDDYDWDGEYTLKPPCQKLATKNRRR
jgi:hypothetical protein